jgi:ABC-type molybdate transport system substrate-binding protein
MNGREFIKVYFAANLTDLFTQIQDEFPKAKILGIIGCGGT